jgi:hypothetical protein
MEHNEKTSRTDMRTIYKQHTRLRLVGGRGMRRLRHVLRLGKSSSVRLLFHIAAKYMSRLTRPTTHSGCNSPSRQRRLRLRDSLPELQRAKARGLVDGSSSSRELSRKPSTERGPPPQKPPLAAEASALRCVQGAPHNKLVPTSTPCHVAHRQRKLVEVSLW